MPRILSSFLRALLFILVLFLMTGVGYFLFADGKPSDSLAPLLSMGLFIVTPIYFIFDIVLFGMIGGSAAKRLMLPVFLACVFSALIIYSALRMAVPV